MHVVYSGNAQMEQAPAEDSCMHMYSSRVFCTQQSDVLEPGSEADYTSAMAACHGEVSLRPTSQLFNVFYSSCRE